MTTKQNTIKQVGGGCVCEDAFDNDYPCLCFDASEKGDVNRDRVLNDIKSLEGFVQAGRKQRLARFEKPFEYYTYYQDWMDFCKFDERARTCVGISEGFRTWLRLKGFGHWVDESDKDFEDRGLDVFKRNGKRDLKEDRQKQIITNDNLSVLVFSQMNSFAKRTSTFGGGILTIQNPYMKINGNCESSNLKYFMKKIEDPWWVDKIQIWKVLSADNYHVINVVLLGDGSEKIVDRSNGCIKYLNLEFYKQMTNMKVLEKYNYKNIGKW